MVSVGIVGTGSFVPPRAVANDELARIVPGTSHDWIVSHTGIRARRFAEPGVMASDLAAHAARAALADADVADRQIGLIVLATSSPDWIQPPTACAVQQKLGLHGVPAFDIGAVCSGWVYGLVVGSAMLGAASGMDAVLVLAGEVYSRVLDWQDRRSSVFFGDGAGAAVLRRVPSDYGVLGWQLLADGDLLDAVGIPAGGARLPASIDTVLHRQHAFRMDGRRVWQFATSALPVVVNRALADACVTVDDVQLFIFHQANARIIDECLRVLKVGRDRTFTTVERYGNTAAASAPITLHEAREAGRVRRDDLVVLVAVGGGMTAGACVMRWY